MWSVSSQLINMILNLFSKGDRLIMAQNITTVTLDDLNTAIDSIAATVKNIFLKKTDASSTYSTKTELSNVTNGTTNIQYTAGTNTSLSASNIKGAIDELGVRTNDTNLSSKVSTILSGYTFSVDTNGDLILTTP